MYIYIYIYIIAIPNRQTLINLNQIRLKEIYIIYLNINFNGYVAKQVFYMKNRYWSLNDASGFFFTKHLNGRQVHKLLNITLDGNRFVMVHITIYE